MAHECGSLAAAGGPIDSAELEETIARQSEATYEIRNIGKARRFVVNGYLAGRKLHPVSVRVPWRKPARTQDDLDRATGIRLAQELEKWKGWPRGRGYSKASFELRWVAAPPPKRGRRKARR